MISTYPFWLLLLDSRQVCVINTLCSDQVLGGLVFDYLSADGISVSCKHHIYQTGAIVSFMILFIWIRITHTKLFMKKKYIHVYYMEGIINYCTMLENESHLCLMFPLINQNKTASRLTDLARRWEELRYQPCRRQKPPHSGHLPHAAVPGSLGMQPQRCSLRRGTSLCWYEGRAREPLSQAEAYLGHHQSPGEQSEVLQWIMQ